MSADSNDFIGVYAERSASIRLENQLHNKSGGGSGGKPKQQVCEPVY
jgi:hypothetical protein